jgi:ribosomal-protein-alanine N-acetyltransferase
MMLRGYEPGDLDAMHALDVTCFERPFRFTRSAMRRFAQARKARVAIAESDAELAGFGILHIERAEDILAGYIVTLDVAPAYRRRGVARDLMLRMEELALNAQCSLMTLHVFVGNADAIQFYRRMGYARSHRARGFYGEGRDALVYHKALVSDPRLRDAIKF